VWHRCEARAHLVSLTRTLPFFFVAEKNAGFMAGIFDY
jgi:hypothetical protein